MLPPSKILPQPVGMLIFEKCRYRVRIHYFQTAVLWYRKEAQGAMWKDHMEREMVACPAPSSHLNQLSRYVSAKVILDVVFVSISG